eukprot:2805842-Pyramimonas_sp.AAC.1
MRRFGFGRTNSKANLRRRSGPSFGKLGPRPQPPTQKPRTWRRAWQARDGGELTGQLQRLRRQTHYQTAQETEAEAPSSRLPLPA